MTIDELKATLSNRSFPAEVQLSVDQKVVDIETFLRVSFIELSQWTRDLEKCPAHLRLMRFVAALPKDA